MKSSQKSKSPRALSRQHSREPSISPRFNGCPAPSPIGLLRRQSPVRDSLSPFPSFNGGPAMQSSLSDYNPLPPRRPIDPQSITQTAPVPEIPNLLLLNDHLRFKDQCLHDMKQRQEYYKKQCELPPRGDWSVPFRNRMESNTTLVLHDGNRIDMGNVDIDTALKKLKRELYLYGKTTIETYSIDGFPNLKMIIKGNRIEVLKPPSSVVTKVKKQLNKVAPAGGRTRARKMGRKGRKGTNKRRRYIVAKTRRQRSRRRGNKPPRTLRN